MKGDQFRVWDKEQIVICGACGYPRLFDLITANGRVQPCRVCELTVRVAELERGVLPAVAIDG